MYRFIALAWRIDDRASEELCVRFRSGLTPGWETAFEAPGLFVLQNKGNSSTHGARSLANKSGVVLGTVFQGTATRISERTGVF
jgi:hypothetical protein